MSKVMSYQETDENIVESTSETVPKIELSSQDYKALLRIVEAEATGEDKKGKILVGNVIMNRVRSEEFPDTVEKVVFQRVGGHVQFSPTADGRYESVDISDETKEAIKDILNGVDYSQGALFFSARDKADPSNMSWFDTNLKWLFEYGGHEFYTVK
ncbi:cell wall hydrolase [Candidatus Galacturonibacter soehngenii]|uniref:Cell wall hydrolase n=2 Tax=Candidatus Galacturonatibacter soehngenii TaxID=2307010 RepID=A0A7V7UD89_9FIRM|nr:cell wall hydrolase [Candidatus Galacturonibacter soehngenii]